MTNQEELCAIFFVVRHFLYWGFTNTTATSRKISWAESCFLFNAFITSKVLFLSYRSLRNINSDQVGGSSLTHEIWHAWEKGRTECGLRDSYTSCWISLEKPKDDIILYKTNIYYKQCNEHATGQALFKMANVLQNFMSWTLERYKGVCSFPEWKGTVKAF